MYCKEKIKDSIHYDKINGEYYFDKKLQDHINIKNEVTPISVCWMIENACNLNCIYCFAEHKNICHEKVNYDAVVKNILNLHPITIILTGGEPTLNPNIKNIIDLIGEKAITIIDSNGTTTAFNNIISSLSNSVVRFSVDSLNSQVLKKVRPSKILAQTDEQIENITNNIKLLVTNNIPIIIQTVMTKININELDSIYQFLLNNGVKRWYISAVKYSEKCKNNFDDIGLTEEEIEIIIDKVNGYKSKTMNVSFSVEQDAGAKSRLFVEKTGKFFVDTIINGIKYVGKNSYSPTHDEICKCLDIKKHYDLYIGKKNILKSNK